MTDTDTDTDTDTIGNAISFQSFRRNPSNRRG